MIDDCVIPPESDVFKILENAGKNAKVVAFSGLPGVGKSLYINQFQIIAKILNRRVTVIQWDVARKAFEIPEIASKFPMGEGVVHNGLKLSAGLWLMDTIKEWLYENKDKSDLLLIEAPLVGHRFVELAKLHSDKKLERFLASDQFQIIVPIPSKTVRAKIEEERAAQVAEDAKNWSGAKPSVMLMIWKMVCGIANEFGRQIPMNSQPPYDPDVYKFVFERILKYRNFIPLFVDEIYIFNIADESELHNNDGLTASAEVALKCANLINDRYPNEQSIDAVVDAWYLA